MAFERFLKIAGYTKEANIKINKYSQFSLNKMVMGRYFDSLKNVFLYYDKEANKIGLEPTIKKEGTFQIMTPHGYKYGVFSAKTFLKEYGIALTATRNFTPTWDEENKMLIVDLNE